MGKKQKKRQDELKKYIVAIDYSRLKGTKLYGAGAIAEDDASLLKDVAKKFPYVGNLTSKQKKQVVSDFPNKIKRIEDKIDLIASTDINRVLESIEPYVKHASEIVVDPTVYPRFREKFPDANAIKENKNNLTRGSNVHTLTLLNIVDSLIRWVKNVAGTARFVFARIKHGHRRIKVK